MSYPDGPPDRDHHRRGHLDDADDEHERVAVCGAVLRF
jgi:hypothetical protein